LRLPFWEAVQRAEKGDIRDGVSIAAIFRVALMALQGQLPEPLAKVLRR
jgi:hypothetical protein